jgi:FKBP-type peptidyl-prolyl cis-trans isomerase
MTLKKVLLGCLILVVFFSHKSISSQTEFKYRFKKTKSGLQYKIINKSKKEKVKFSQRIFVTYDMYHQKDTSKCKIIIKNAKKEFLLGYEEVLAGWEEGVALLRSGDSVVFKLPPHLAYGDKKFGSILPNSFIYLVLKVDSAKTIFFNHTGKDTIKFASGLKKIVSLTGSGPKALSYQEASINFTAYVYSTKGYRQIFEETSKGKKNLLFQLGIGQFIKGLDEGILSMNVGEKATFIIPSYLGYGARQVGKILANTTLYYDIELLEAKNPFFEYQSKKKITTKDSVDVYIVDEKGGDLITNENVVLYDYKAYYKNKENQSVLFDNSFQRLKSPMLRPGSGRGFPGIENALLNLKNGEKATVIISEKMIENKKKFPFLDTGSFIYYDIYIKDVYNYQFMSLSNNDTIKKTNGLKWLEIQPGDGTEIKKGDKVRVAYTIYFMNKAGQRIIMDASREREKWLELEIGSGANIQGFDEGLIGMKEGGYRRIIIPPSLGYGKDGLPERGLLPHTDLIVDIEGIRINK